MRTQPAVPAGCPAFSDAKFVIHVGGCGSSRSRTRPSGSHDVAVKIWQFESYARSSDVGGEVAVEVDRPGPAVVAAGDPGWTAGGVAGVVVGVGDAAVRGRGIAADRLQLGRHRGRAGTGGMTRLASFTPRPFSCRAAQRATAAPAGTTPTAPGTRRRSSSTRPNQRPEPSREPLDLQRVLDVSGAARGRLPLLPGARRRQPPSILLSSHTHDHEAAAFIPQDSHAPPQVTSRMEAAVLPHRGRPPLTAAGPGRPKMLTLQNDGLHRAVQLELCRWTAGGIPVQAAGGELGLLA